MAFPITLLLSLLCLSGTRAELVQCIYRMKEATVIRAGHVAERSTADSNFDCLASLCRCRSRCVASFNAGTRQCWAAAYHYKLVHLSGGAILDAVANGSWVTLARNDPVGVSPAGALWLLDAVMRGQSVGVDGARFSVAAVSNTEWTGVGPLGVGGFATFSATSTFTAMLPSTFRLSKAGFTLAVWVRTQLTNTRAPIFEFANGNARRTHFWFHPSVEFNQFWVNYLPSGGENNGMTGTNSTGRMYWRHLALVYSAAGGTHVYVNGSSWAFTGSNTNPEIPDHDRLFLGYSPFDAKHLQGNMACAAIYLQALPQSEVRELMDSCP